MGTFVIAHWTRESKANKNGSHDMVDVLRFGKEPKMYSTIEEAAEEAQKIVEKNPFSTWSIFKHVADTKIKEVPVETVLIEDEDFASSAEP